MEHLDEILFPELVGEIVPARQQRPPPEPVHRHLGRAYQAYNTRIAPAFEPRFGGGFVDDVGQGVRFNIPRMNDYFGDIGMRFTFQPRSGSSGLPIPTFWECTVEDISYNLNCNDVYVSETSTWVDNIGERLDVNAHHLEIKHRTMHAILRLWRSSRVVSLVDLCLRRLHKIPEEDLQDICQQFMQVDRLSDIMQFCSPRADTVRRILRSRYDRFLISHHYMSCSPSGRHFSLYAPCNRMQHHELISHSDHVQEIQPHYSVIPRCSLAAWMRYHRMRTEMLQLCSSCSQLAKIEISHLTFGSPRPYGTRVGACKCNLGSLRQNIWYGNKYLHDKLKELETFFRYDDWVGHALIKHMQPFRMGEMREELGPPTLREAGPPTLREAVIANIPQRFWERNSWPVVHPTRPVVHLRKHMVAPVRVQRAVTAVLKNRRTQPRVQRRQADRSHAKAHRKNHR